MHVSERAERERKLTRTERLREEDLAVARGAVAHRVVRVAAAAGAGRRARLLEQLRLREDAAINHLQARPHALQVPHLQHAFMCVSAKPCSARSNTSCMPTKISALIER